RPQIQFWRCDIYCAVRCARGCDRTIRGEEEVGDQIDIATLTGRSIGADKTIIEHNKCRVDPDVAPVDACCRCDLTIQKINKLGRGDVDVAAVAASRYRDAAIIAQFDYSTRVDVDGSRIAHCRCSRDAASVLELHWPTCINDDLSSLAATR